MRVTSVTGFALQAIPPTPRSGHGFSSLVGAPALFPAVELDFVRPGGTVAGFEKRLQAEQKDPPLGATMMHELYRLLLTLVFEEDDRPVAFLS